MSSSARSATSEWITLPSSQGSFPAFLLRHPSGQASLTIAQHGATVLSWKILDQELLFVSDKATFAPGKAIRGGIPVVFPQFGPGQLPQHGFARNKVWTHGETTINKTTGDISTAFHLESDADTLAVWPHHFRLTMTVTLKATSFAQRLTVENNNPKPSDIQENKSADSSDFTFTALLHTYFSVPNPSRATVKGLKGLMYMDKVEKNEEFIEGDELLAFGGREVDRVYIGGGKKELIISDGGNCDLVLKCSGFEDMVTWNPWIERAESMADLGAQNAKKFVCVEAGSVKEPVKLGPGEKWDGIQGISLKLNASGSGATQGK